MAFGQRPIKNRPAAPLWGLLVALLFSCLLTSAPLHAQSPAQLRQEFYSLDFKIRQWRQLQAQNPNAVLPRGLLKDVDRRSQLAAQLAVTDLETAQKVEKVSAAKDTLESLAEVEKQRENANKGIELAIKGLEEEEAYISAWNRRYQTALETGEAAKKSSVWSRENRVKLLQIQDRLKARQKTIQTRLDALQRKKIGLKFAKGGLEGVMSAAGVYGDIQKGEFFDAADKAVDFGKTYAELTKDEKAFKALASRLDAGKGALKTAQHLADGNVLAGLEQGTSTVLKHTPDYTQSIANEKEFIDLIESSAIADPELKKRAAAMTQNAKKRLGKLEKSQEIRKTFNRVNESTKKARKTLKYLEEIRSFTAMMQGRAVQFTPGMSTDEARLIGGMKFTGEKLRAFSQSLPPGLKQSVGQLLEFYATALESGANIRKFISNAFKERECDNLYRWSPSHAKRYVAETYPGLYCLKPTPEFRETVSLYVKTLGEAEYPEYLFVPDMDQDPIPITKNEYNELADIAAAFSACAVILEDSYQLDNDDITNILQAVRGKSESFTLSDGYLGRFFNTSHNIADLKAKADALLHIRAAVGEELNADNADRLIQKWRDFLDEDTGFCLKRLFNDDKQRHRVFVTYLKDYEAFRNFKLRQELFRKDSRCRLKLKISGPAQGEQGTPAVFTLKSLENDFGATPKIPPGAKVQWRLNNTPLGAGMKITVTGAPPGRNTLDAVVRIKDAAGSAALHAPAHLFIVKKKQSAPPKEKNPETRPPDTGVKNDALTPPPKQPPPDTPKERAPDIKTPPKSPETPEEREQDTRETPPESPQLPRPGDKPPHVKNDGDGAEKKPAPPPKERDRKKQTPPPDAPPPIDSDDEPGDVPETPPEDEAERFERIAAKRRAWCEDNITYVEYLRSANRAAWSKMQGRIPPGKGEHCYQEPAKAYQQNIEDFNLARKYLEKLPWYYLADTDEWLEKAQEYIDRFRNTVLGNYPAPVTFTFTSPCNATGSITSKRLENPHQLVRNEQVPGKDSRETKTPPPKEQNEENIELTLKPARPVPSPLPVGAKAPFIVSLSGVENPDAYVLRWQPLGEVTFSKAEGRGVYRNTALFERSGTFTVWVEALKKSDGVLSTAGQSNALEFQVSGSDITLEASPQSPFVGQETTVRARENPPLPQGAASWWWEISGKTISPGHKGDQRAYSFTPRDEAPVTVTAHLKEAHSGKELATASITINARLYRVEVKNLGPMGPPAKEWKDDGLVEKKKPITVFQDVGLAADISPTPAEATLRYAWKVNEGCSLSGNPASKETRAQRATPGACEAMVEIRDQRNVLLGAGKTSFQAVKQPENNKKPEKKKISSKEEKCLALHKEALAFSKESKDADAVIKRYKKVLKQCPSNCLTMNNIGVQYAALKNDKTALSWYRKAQQCAPEKELFKNNIGRAKSRQAYERAVKKMNANDDKGAEKELRQSLRHNPKNCNSMIFMAVMRDSRKRTQDALSWYEKAMACDPKNTKLKARAEKVRTRGTSFGPCHQALQAALAKHNAGKLKSARKAYLKILEQCPEECDAINNLGVIAENRGRNADALTWYEKAAQCNPKKFGKLPAAMRAKMKKLGQKPPALSKERPEKPRPTPKPKAKKPAPGKCNASGVWDMTVKAHAASMIKGVCTIKQNGANISGKCEQEYKTTFVTRSFTGAVSGGTFRIAWQGKTRVKNPADQSKIHNYGGKGAMTMSTDCRVLKGPWTSKQWAKPVEFILRKR